MTSTQVKNQVRDTVEQGFDTLHRVADVVTFPLAPLDGAIHGTARGILNWVTDTHPEDRLNTKKNPLKGCVPAPAPGYGPPSPHGNYAPPPSPPSYNYPAQSIPGHPYWPYPYNYNHSNADNKGINIGYPPSAYGNNGYPPPPPPALPSGYNYPAQPASGCPYGPYPYNNNRN